MASYYNQSMEANMLPATGGFYRTPIYNFDPYAGMQQQQQYVAPTQYSAVGVPTGGVGGGIGNMLSSGAGLLGDVGTSLGVLPEGGLSGLLGNSEALSGLSGLFSSALPGTGISYTLPAGVAGPVGVGGGLSAMGAMGAGALGGLGYTMLGSKLGLPQSKVSPYTSGLGGALGAWGGSALAGTGGMALGATMGSVVPVLGTALGAIAGGLAGSLFGAEKKTKPSIYTGTYGIPLLEESWGDTLGTTKPFEEGAWYDRANPEDAQGLFQNLAGETKKAVQTANMLRQVLPKEEADKLIAGMQGQLWEVGRKKEGATSSWNFQENGFDTTYKNAVTDIENNVMNALKRSVEAGGVDLSTAQITGLTNMADLRTILKDRGINIDGNSGNISTGNISNSGDGAMSADYAQKVKQFRLDALAGRPLQY